MKRIMIKYTTEIPNDVFDRFCKDNLIGKNTAVEILRKRAISSAEDGLDDWLHQYGK